ncbi:uncharacterized protein LY89DRAFT_710536 [Mollisia scopiformis]|uniref:Uncharacterized protein n=1 Tax=Mollisia scopiformis TaxID=149040 RepID=A0A194WT22_MOLSC|nr:uncharacterized protein LY89DRAFT_710536 [Mollisia scopiformis]KUJ10767.1 hypothetical protein LY89DRAFT_710536 [Mollisia scopiformis]
MLSQLFFSFLLLQAIQAKTKDDIAPIVLSRTGGFEIGGKVLVNPANPNQTLSCDHDISSPSPPPRRTSLLMWHSSSTQVFQNRWDGGPGYKDLFLSRNYPVYLWDGPRVGRANWARVPLSYTPAYRDQGNFVAWNFGPRLRARGYDEFDTDENVWLHGDVMAVAADSGKLGTDLEYLTNSAGGLRAQLATTRANGTNIKGIVTYESIGYVFPDNIGLKPNTVPGFGPFVVPVEEFKKLANVTAIQFVRGDHRDETFEYVKQSRQVAALINQYGGNAEVVMLGKDKGLKGSTHIAFAVAGVLDEFLERNGLDGYTDEDEE